MEVAQKPAIELELWKSLANISHAVKASRRYSWQIQLLRQWQSYCDRLFPSGPPWDTFYPGVRSSRGHDLGVGRPRQISMSLLHGSCNSCKFLFNCSSWWRCSMFFPVIIEFLIQEISIEHLWTIVIALVCFHTGNRKVLWWALFCSIFKLHLDAMSSREHKVVILDRFHL